MQVSNPIIFQPRRDSHVNWMISNPVLLHGELAYDYDTHRFRIGDGVKHWRDLVPFDMPTSWCGYAPDGTPLLRFRIPNDK